MRDRWYEQLPDPTTAAAVQAFTARLLDRRDEFASLAARACGSPVAHHFDDVAATIAECGLLASHRLELTPRTVRQPRGNVLLGLSANEPLVVGVVPLIAGLLYGNRLVVRPASRNYEIMSKIVQELHSSGIPHERLTLSLIAKNDVGRAIAAADHVVWFGAAKTCRTILQQAINASVGCTVEAEGFDVVVVEHDASDALLASAADLIVKSVARHSGQTCQAIRAVIVAASRFETFLPMLRSAASALVVGPAEDEATGITRPIEIVTQDAITFPESAPFGPVILAGRYTSDVELERILRENPYGLSLCVYTETACDAVFRSFAPLARVGRIIVNGDPSRVDSLVPWGGYRRTGSGPSTWAEKFTDLIVRYDSHA